MESYSAFAEVYDYLMGDVDYEAWTERIERKMIELNFKPRFILDVACGTGNITIELAKKGYNVMGLDISQDMLTVAKNKAHEAGFKLDFLQQDMKRIEYTKRFDLILSICDGINYQIEDGDLDEVFESVHRHLAEEGYFIFDISSYFKISEVLGNNTFAENYDKVSYIWENYFAENLLEFDLTIFKKEGKLFRRYHEFHTQRAYMISEIKEALEPYFELVEVLDGDTYMELNGDSERISFICRKR